MSAQISEYLPGEDENQSEVDTQCLPPPRAVPLGELQIPLPDSNEEILRHRYLCRGGGLLLVGPTGIGKSSLSMQCMISWSLGRPVFGIQPVREIRSLLFQAENDDGDLAEMRDGIVKGLDLTIEEQQAAVSRILVVRENSRAGGRFFAETVRPMLEAHRPDLIWIDPALAFLDGEANAQQDVGEFLRRQLNPLLTEFGCGAVVVHHTTKPPKRGETNNTLFGEAAYLGSGSAEWANWSRAVLALRATASAGVFELHAGKRGGRLRWVDEDGETRVFSKYISQARGDGEIYWRPATREEINSTAAKGNKIGTSEEGKVLALIPTMESISKSQLIALCAPREIGRDKAYKILARLIERGDIEERSVPRDGKRPEVHIARIHRTPLLASSDKLSTSPLSSPPPVPKEVIESIQAIAPTNAPVVPDLPECSREVRNIRTIANIPTGNGIIDGTSTTNTGNVSNQPFEPLESHQEAKTLESASNNSSLSTVCRKSKQTNIRSGRRRCHSKGQ